MKRRETLKSLLVGGVAGIAVGTSSCKSDLTVEEAVAPKKAAGYGRTPSELLHDETINAEVFLTESELATIAILCDIILPATPEAGSATDAGVVEFIDFIVKDLPNHQLPLRGGLMWLDIESNSRYNKVFSKCSNQEQLGLIDDIAYPDVDSLTPNLEPGRHFFNTLRNLTLTGYYTSEMGIKDLGYVGNRPNLWDGVPEEILKEHGFSYDSKLLPKYVDHEKRNDVAVWDQEGNLLS